MRETIQQQQAMIDTYHQQPWLEDMISRANEVLNALLRLQKQQMAAQEERRQVHFYNTPYAPPGFYVCPQRKKNKQCIHHFSLFIQNGMPTENSTMHHDDNGHMTGSGRIRRKRRVSIHMFLCRTRLLTSLFIAKTHFSRSLPFLQHFRDTRVATRT